MIALRYHHYKPKDPMCLALRAWHPDTPHATPFIAQRQDDRKLYIYDGPMYGRDAVAGPFEKLRVAIVALEMLV